MTNDKKKPNFVDPCVQCRTPMLCRRNQQCDVDVEFRIKGAKTHDPFDFDVCTTEINSTKGD